MTSNAEHDAYIYVRFIQRYWKGALEPEFGKQLNTARLGKIFWETS